MSRKNTTRVGNSLTPNCPVCENPMQLMDGKVCSPRLTKYAAHQFYVCTTHDMRVRCYPETLKAMGRPADATLREERQYVDERMEALVDAKIRRDKVSGDEARAAGWKWLSGICGRKVTDAEELNIAEVSKAITQLRPKDDR